MSEKKVREHIAESCNYYFISNEDGFAYAQRKHVDSPAERPLHASEKIIIDLCERLINADKLIKKLEQSNES